MSETPPRGPRGGVLVLFAKEPTPGKVKTRMTPPFSAQQAAELYECLLQDTLDASRSMAKAHDLHFVMAIDPPEALPFFRARCPEGTHILLQRGVTLGERLAKATRELAQEGFSPILIRGSDSPGLSESDIEQALTALAHSELVVCPDRDGGYNLIGMRSACDALFDLSMSTGSVLNETLEAAKREGLSAELLPPGFDLDCVEDLRAAEAFFSTESCRQCCPYTSAFLARAEIQTLLAEASSP